MTGGATRRGDDRWQRPDPTGLTHRIQHHGAVLVLGLSGQLTGADQPAVREALLRSLAECPAALVVDLSGVRVTGDEPVVAIPAALRDARGWPPVPVLLCGAGPELVGRLDRLGVTGPARHLATRELALAAASDRWRVDGRVTATLPATPQAPAQGRALLHRACRGWRLDAVAHAAEVIVSELCANAVTHARTSMRLIVNRTATHLYLVVRDGDRDLPLQRPLPPGGAPVDTGNGLHLVAAFATAWGAMPTTDGKAVWASLRLPIGRSV
jgi:anti-anti-sigma regulatory factor/anti-sigma regulatory factor (Ser/Thr protein kinase)